MEHKATNIYHSDIYVINPWDSEKVSWNAYVQEVLDKIIFDGD